MDGHGVLDPEGITAGQGDGHGHTCAQGRLHHEPVPLPQAAHGQRQPAQLVLIVGIRAGQVDDQVGPVLPERRERSARAALQVLLIAGLVGQMDVDVGGGFSAG